MAWSLSSFTVRLGAIVTVRRRWTAPEAVAAAQSRSLRRRSADVPSVFERASDRRSEAMSAADRKAYEAAFDEFAGDADILYRAFASGAPLSAVATLSAKWGTLPEATRSLVRDPVGRVSDGPVAFGRVKAIQVDQTTCGAAVMGLMAMMTDPFVALWVASGQHAGDYRPPEVLRIESERMATGTVEQRWKSLQRSNHLASTRHALWVVSWPRAWGTPPWRIDDVVRCAGVKFDSVTIDPGNEVDTRAILTHVSAALADGIPVPLFTSGDSARGLSTVIPRHVVLAVARTADGLRLYEPSRGALYSVTEQQLATPGAALPALGHWNRLAVAVVPRARG